MKSLLGVLRGLLADASRLLPEVRGFDRDFVTLEARFKNEGIGFLSVALPTLGKSLDLGIEERRFTCPDGFRKLKGGEIPRLFSGILCKVFDPSTGIYIENAPVEYISVLRQLCYLCKKFVPTDDVNLRLASEARADFVQCDNEISSIAGFRADHIAHISNFVLQNLDGFQELDCRHGPGAVMEGYKPNQKWSALYSRLFDLDDRLISVGYDVVSFLHCDHEFQSDYHDSSRSESARLVTVPKSSTALRTITVEPMLNQFVQQGLNAFLRNEIEHCPVMSLCLTLPSQVPNQNLALEGSLTGEWVTIDLSSASDRLSTKLVEIALANRPRYLSAILGCRTPSVDLGESTLFLRKYAGMGNATTFPIQSYVFALIALASMIPLHSRVTIEKLKRLAGNVHVFGDDIVIRRKHFSGFADWIESCGLKINRKKTFSKGDFRESCGVDAFRGQKVTPVYLRHDPDKTSTDAEAFVGVLSTSNQLWLQCMYSTSAALDKLLDKRVRLPLVSQKSAGLGYHTRQDVCTYQRWSSTLHRFEVRTLSPTSVRVKDRLDGVPALMKYFHNSSSTRSDSTHRMDYLDVLYPKERDAFHLQSSVRRFNLNLRKRWVPSK
jgi:hypothetical protein